MCQDMYDKMMTVRIQNEQCANNNILTRLDEHDFPQWYDIVHFEHKLSWLCFWLPQKASYQWRYYYLIINLWSFFKLTGTFIQQTQWQRDKRNIIFSFPKDATEMEVTKLWKSFLASTSLLTTTNEKRGDYELLTSREWVYVNYRWTMLTIIKLWRMPSFQMMLV